MEAAYNQTVGLVNFKASSSEIIKLKAAAQAGGYESLSRYLRVTCGLSPDLKRNPDVIPLREDLDIEHILPLLLRQTNAMDQIDRATRRIAKSLGVDLTLDMPARTPSPATKTKDFSRG